MPTVGAIAFRGQFQGCGSGAFERRSRSEPGRAHCDIDPAEPVNISNLIAFEQSKTKQGKPITVNKQAKSKAKQQK